MNLSIPHNASPEAATVWYRQLLRTLGPGFHPDTPPNDYVDDAGRPTLSPHEAQQLDSSLHRLFEILGDEEPYSIGADETRLMLAIRKHA